MSGLPDPRERPWLSVAEVAKITGEGEKAIRSAIDAGHLKSFRLGRYVRIPTASLYEMCGIGPPGDEAAAPPRTAAEVGTNGQLEPQPKFSVAQLDDTRQHPAGGDAA